MLDKDAVVKLFNEGKKIHELAEMFNTTKGAVYMALYRSGVHVGRGDTCRQAAEYSRIHGVQEAALKFGMKKEAVYNYRRKYK